MPADGFYEWQQADGKQPYHICEKGHWLFAFAGLGETWHEGQEDELFSFTIIVTDTNPALSSIHKRMPVILDPDEYSAWLDPGADISKLLPMLSPYAGWLVLFPVSRSANSPKEKGLELIKEAKLK